MNPIALRVLSEDEKQMIHEATLEILRTVGVRVCDPDLRGLLRDRGADVDDSTGDVKLSRELVMKCLSAAPKSFELADRRGRQLPIPAKESYICSRVLLPKILDYGAKTPRDPVSSDVIKACQIANALDGVDFILRTDAPVLDYDAAPGLNGLLSIQTAMTYTGKHFLCLPINYEAMQNWLAIAEAATESGDLAKERVITIGISTTTPLQLDEESSRILRLAAEKGLAVFTLPMPAGGGTAPITTAGEIVLMNTEVLFMLSAVQMINPSSPVFYSGIPCTLDLRTGLISLSSPEFPPMVSGGLEMGRFYSLPLVSSSKFTDSQTFDEQCGAQKSLSTFASLASGADILYANGDFDNAYTLSLEQIVIDLDLVLAARRFVRGIIVDKDRLAVEAIKRIGPGRHYLEDEHTLRFLRSEERLSPKSFNRLGHRSTARSQLEKAHELVEHLTSRQAEPAITEAAMARMRVAAEERKRKMGSGE